jgi:hypothetical protein
MSAIRNGMARPSRAACARRQSTGSAPRFQRSVEQVVDPHQIAIR